MLFSIIAIHGMLYAQNMRIEAPPGYNIIYMENNLPKNIEGSPFLDDWQLSDILLKNGDVISGIMLRYNVLTDQMLFQSNNNAYVIGAPENILEIKLPNRIFAYKYFLKSRKIEKGFFEIILSGKVGLAIKYQSKVISSNYNVALGVGNKNDTLINQEKLYLDKEGQIIQLNKEKVLFEVLNDKYKEVSDFIEKENLSYKSKEDMIKLLTFYNQ